MVVAGKQLQIDLAQLLIGAFVFEPKVGQCDPSVNDGQAVLFCDLSLPLRPLVIAPYLVKEPPAGKSIKRKTPLAPASEHRRVRAKGELVGVAGRQQFEGDEIRQAAVWGLGKSGLKAYEELLPFIADADDNVALHAIVAFGNDTPEKVVRDLVQELVTVDRRRAPAASEALRQIGNETVVRVLIEAAADSHDWVVATLGRLPPALVRPAVEGSALMGVWLPCCCLVRVRTGWHQRIT